MPHVINLCVPHPIGLDQLAEPDEELWSEQLVGAGAFGFGNEAKHPLGIAVCECRHGSQRYDECRMDSTPRSGEPLSPT